MFTAFSEILFWFDEYSKLERIVVSLDLLDYHLVIQHPKKVHPYKCLGQVMPNYCCLKNETLKYYLLLPVGNSKQND